jgi:hypothetical protein
MHRRRQRLADRTLPGRKIGHFESRRLRVWASSTEPTYG